MYTKNMFVSPQGNAYELTCNKFIEHPASDILVLHYSLYKDRKGTPIYEGDIISLKNEVGEDITAVCERGLCEREVVSIPNVTHNVDISSFYLVVNGRKTFPIRKNYLGVSDLSIMEVIGNIYETNK